MEKIVIYTSNHCHFCVLAKNLLQSKGLEYEEIDVSNDMEARAELVKKSNGMRTVPQIFFGDEHVGGYDDLVKRKL